MNQEIAQENAKKLQIDITQVVREYWEMEILQKLFDSPIGEQLIFKGGTALRLAYQSPRFSEDLDFSLTKSTNVDNFKSVCKNIENKYQEIKISDFKDKFYTILAEFKVTESYLSRNFSIKIEISKRKTNSKGELKLITSDTSNLQVLGRVQSLSEILAEKIVTIKDRQKPRDYFDIWYICEKLSKLMPAKLPKIDKNDLNRDLSKFLPATFRKVITILGDKYGS
jgi:predicted nucleotidyltransferase component of viral defense system